MGLELRPLIVLRITYHRAGRREWQLFTESVNQNFSHGFV